MKTKTLLAVAVLALVVCAVADSPRGLRPRTQPSEYPVFQQQESVSIGAEQLSAKEVSNSFASELNGHYVVIEVGIYPAFDSVVEVSPDRFVLRVPGTTTLLRPVSPETIATVLQKKPASNHDVALYPSIGVGYETGGRDVNGNRRGPGWTTEAGVRTSVDNTPKAGTPADRKTMETELRDKSLPEGKIGKSVAGYLYFPLPTAKKLGYQLEYSARDQSIKIDLPKPVQ